MTDPASFRVVVVDGTHEPVLGSSLQAQSGLMKIERESDRTFVATALPGTDQAALRASAPGYWPEVLFVTIDRIVPGEAVPVKLRRAPSIRVLDPAGREIPEWRAEDLACNRIGPEDAVQLLPSGRVVIAAPGFLPLLAGEFGLPDASGVIGLMSASGTRREYRDVYLMPLGSLPLTIINLEGVSERIYFEGELTTADPALAQRIATACKGMPQEWVSAYTRWLGATSSNRTVLGSIVCTGERGPPLPSSKTGRTFRGSYVPTTPLIVLGEARGRLTLWPTGYEQVDLTIDTIEGALRIEVTPVPAAWIETHLDVTDCGRGAQVQVRSPIVGAWMSANDGEITVLLPPSAGTATVLVAPAAGPSKLVSIVPGVPRTLHCDARSYLVRFAIEGGSPTELIHEAVLGSVQGHRRSSDASGAAVWLFEGIERASATQLRLRWLNPASQTKRWSTDTISTTDWQELDSGLVNEIRVRP